MNRTVAVLPLGVLLAATIAACAPHAAQAPSPDAPETAAPATEQAGPAPADNPTGRLGDTLTLNRAEGAKIAVTLERIITPATVTPGPAEPGKTYLAAALQLADPDTRPLQGDVNVNVTLTGSDGHRYSADLHNVTDVHQLRRRHVPPRTRRHRRRLRGVRATGRGQPRGAALPPLGGLHRRVRGVDAELT